MFGLDGFAQVSFASTGGSAPWLWTNISPSQPANWGLVNDDDSAVWSDINPSQSASWGEIDDTQYIFLIAINGSYITTISGAYILAQSSWIPVSDSQTNNWVNVST